ncbi:MAG: HD domain-containing protein [Candidatus Latescibacterota bacterium]|nr:MAG: HD domain-containing protein [Candidatus Latescibacterota bacterium]
MLHLRIIRGPGNQERLSITEKGLPFTVGRDRENKLHIQSTAVSRFHAVLLAEQGDHFVQDMDSTNGTFLNGKKVKKVRIHPGDTITIADVDIMVENAPSPLEETQAPLDLTVSIDTPIPSDSTITVKNPTEEILIRDLLDKSVSRDSSKSYAALQVLYRADKIARDIDDFKLLLENLMDLTLEVIPASRGYILLVDRESGKLVPYVRRAPSSISDDTELVVSKTILNTAVGQKESLLSKDALVDERFLHSRSVGDLKVRSAMCAPLVNRGKVLGIIYLDSSDQSNLYTKEDLALLTAMALKAGVSLDNARLYDDLRNLFYNTVETLVRAIQARDQYTSGHSARVSRYALLIAEKYGLSTREKHHLYLASMLHDIGKIGIPDRLLNRPGDLAEEEIEQVRSHVKMGASMLKALGEMHPVVPLILHHHEAYDGSGYPDGLKGEQIPLMSRVLSVADTYDAMTSDRPYRQAMSKADAIAELKRCSGTSFDPKVVNVFLEILEEQSSAVIEIEEPQFTSV